MKIIDKIHTNESMERDYPIGHIFNLYDIKLIVKEGGQCRYCFFSSDLKECVKHKCSPFNREDEKSVSFHVFKDYENNKKNKFKKWFWSLFNRRQD